jgi:FAD/FMN-containing dehydrogenase
VGGAIASDIHGKNHHRDGCFSRSVRSFDLMQADGRIIHCSRKDYPELFRATCGGMGLTGVILKATLDLRPVPGPAITETAYAARNLNEIFDLFQEHAQTRYSVAWMDCLSRGPYFGRSILYLGDHADSKSPLPDMAPSFTVPFDMPGFLLNRHLVNRFNRFRFRRARPVCRRTTSCDRFFFPLDGLTEWNRLYGPAGLIQYQPVFPEESSFEGIRAILTRIHQTGVPCFLGVLKLLGPANENLLSFPMKGYTMALDFKVQDTLFPLLRELDRIVIHHGGRLYLAKDARMAPEVFRTGYPGWKDFVRLRKTLGLNRAFQSLQSQRLRI